METRILHYFLTVAKLGTISAAARELHVAQPTISRQLQQLEDELDTQLFIRERRRMVLTRAGTFYRQQAATILAQLDQANQDVAQINNDDLVGSVHLGMIESRIVHFLSPLIMQFHRRYPQVKFEVYDADGEEIKERLDQGLLDLGIVSSPISTTKYHSVKLPLTDRWGLAVSPDSPLAKRDRVNVADLQDLPLIVPHRALIQDEMRTWFANHDARLQVVAETNLLSNACYLAAAGLGNVVCIEGAPRPAAAKLKFLPLEPVHQQLNFLIWRKNVNLSEPARRLITTLVGHIDSQNE